MGCSSRLWSTNSEDNWVFDKVLILNVGEFEVFNPEDTVWCGIKSNNLQQQVAVVVLLQNMISTSGEDQIWPWLRSYKWKELLFI